MPSAAAFPTQSSESDWKLSDNGQHYTFTKPLVKSDNDDRDYRLIRLDNKLQVLLIHDKDTDKSSAALDVHVGHLSDPVSKDRHRECIFGGSHTNNDDTN